MNSQIKLSHLLLIVVLISTLAFAQAPQKAQPDPGLVGALTQKLGVTPDQAVGGAGAIFAMAKGHLTPSEFNKIASVVPGMGGFLKAAPDQQQQQQQQPDAAASAASALGQITGSGSSSEQGGNAKNSAGASPAMPATAGGLFSLGGAFKSLGMSPQMATQFAPVIQQYLSSRGGSGVSSLFSTAIGM